jgi:hypothetical protein
LTVFTHPGVELEVDGPAIPACTIDKLRKQASVPGARLTPEVYDQLGSYLERLTLPA